MLVGNYFKNLKSIDYVEYWDLRSSNATFNLDRQVYVNTAGNTCDFVSRFFAPNAGIVEDPVTGSSHCTLIPYWYDKLQKKDMVL